jgi:hypothetical protein
LSLIHVFVCTCVFVADPLHGAATVHFYDVTRSGWPSNQLAGLTRAVAQYVKEGSNVKSFYIGIASGADLLPALKSRYDDVKKGSGISHVYCIYSSKTSKHTTELEAQLLQHFKGQARNINEVAGGGGNTGAGPNFYVYLALRRWG